MKHHVVLLGMLSPYVANAQAIRPGNWDVTSKAIELVVPGTPGFLLRMATGRSKVEHKCVTSEQAKGGVSALLAPDPKAQCRLARVQIAGGIYEQLMLCVQKSGDPMRIAQSGSYDTTSFTGRLTMTGQTAKGQMRVVVDQMGKNMGPACRK